MPSAQPASSSSPAVYPSAPARASRTEGLSAASASRCLPAGSSAVPSERPSRSRAPAPCPGPPWTRPAAPSASWTVIVTAAAPRPDSHSGSSGSGSLSADSRSACGT